jgi:hypothetical protein
MTGFDNLGLALTAAYAAAAASFPGLAAPRVIRMAVLIAAGGAILASPLFVPPARPLLRLVAALNAIALAVKLCDLHADHGRAHRFTFPSFLTYLANWFNLVPRTNPPCPPPDHLGNGRRLVAGLMLLGSGIVMSAAAFHVRWASVPFLLEHMVKVTAVYVAVAGGVGAAALRLAGAVAITPMAHPEFAPTPAEFWRRWNRPAQRFFYEDVFKPCGGLRPPVRGTLVTFAVTAAVHEYVFGIAAGRVQGYQAAFFLLQGCAAAVTLRARPTGTRRVVGIALTLTFVFASSMLFFRSVDAIVPFYDR